MTLIFKNISSIGKYRVREAGPKYIFNVLNRRYTAIYPAQPALSYNGATYRCANEYIIKTDLFTGVDTKTPTQTGVNFTGITHDGTNFVLSTILGKIYTSADLTTFTLASPTSVTNAPTQIISSGSNYFMMTSNLWVYHGTNLASLTQSSVERNLSGCCTDGTYWYVCTNGGSAYGNYIKRAPIGSGSFTTLWSDGQNNAAYKPYSITHNNGTIIAGTGGYIYRSTDASNYTSWSFIAATGAGGIISRIIHANGNWYALSAGVSRSTNDGVSWSAASGVPSDITWVHLHTVDANILYLVGYTGEIAKSVNNGSSWQLINGLGYNGFSSIIRTPANTTCISDLGSTVYRNNTGVFTKNAAVLPNYAVCMVSTQVGIYATNEAETATDPRISKSTNDGATFASVTGPGTSNLYGEAEFSMATDGNSTIVTGVNTGYLFRTTDGTNWVDTGINVGSGVDLPPNVFYVNNKFFAFGRRGTGLPTIIKHAISDDGITWNLYNIFSTASSGAVAGLAFNGTHYFALMGTLAGDKLYRSSDGINWSALASNLDSNIDYSYNRIEQNPSGLIYDGYNLMMCTNSGKILSSVDGVTWVEKHSGEQQFLSIAKLGSDIYAIGVGGTVVHTSLTA